MEMIVDDWSDGFRPQARGEDDARRCCLMETTASRSHDLILRETPSLLCTLHGIFPSRIEIFDEGQAERTSTVLVAGEFG